MITFTLDEMTRAIVDARLKSNPSSSCQDFSYPRERGRIAFMLPPTTANQCLKQFLRRHAYHSLYETFKLAM